jgi:hypothetical protein
MDGGVVEQGRHPKHTRKTQKHQNYQGENAYRTHRTPAFPETGTVLRSHLQDSERWAMHL